MFVETLFRATDDGIRLLGARCPRCGRHSFPARAVCGECGARDQQSAELSGRGTVHAATRVSVPPAGFDAGYLFAAIDLDEGPRTFGVLLEPVEAEGHVRAVPARLRDGVQAFGFAPAR